MKVNLATFQRSYSINYTTMRTAIFIWNEVICSSDLSDDVAYMLTKAAFACQPQVARAHVGGETLLPENVAYITIPLHPGAIRFYEEIGIKLNPCHYPEGYSK